MDFDEMWTDEMWTSEMFIGVIAIAGVFGSISIVWWIFYPKNSQASASACAYSYNHSGTSEWCKKFPSCAGDHQSPINIVTCQASPVCSNCLHGCLKFSSQFHKRPTSIRAYNDGHSVVLHVRYGCLPPGPHVFGGPVKVPYQFYNARFRWGPNDDEGSEHYINCHRYAMELQAMHLKMERHYQTLTDAIEDDALLMISYLFEAYRFADKARTDSEESNLFQAVGTDNPFLKGLVDGLTQITEPFTSVEIEPVPLACIMPPFDKNYFMYCGSLTFPPCTEGVKWLVQPEPLCISRKQVNQFRKLYGIDGPICSNTRPIQNLNSRAIVYFD